MLGFYDPLVGRFTSPDPIKDVSSANAVNPYVYCMNNPLRYTDKFGLAAAQAPIIKGGDEIGGGSGGGWGDADMKAQQKLNELEAWSEGWTHLTYGMGSGGANPGGQAAQGAQQGMVKAAAGGNPDPSLVVATEAFISGCVCDTDNPRNVPNGLTPGEWEDFRREGAAWAAQSGDRWGYAEFESEGPEGTVPGNFAAAIEEAKAQAGCQLADRIFLFAHGAGDHIVDYNGEPVGAYAAYSKAKNLIKVAADHLVEGGFFYVWACYQYTGDWNAIGREYGINVVVLPWDNAAKNPLGFVGKADSYWRNIKQFEARFRENH